MSKKPAGKQKSQPAKRAEAPAPVPKASRPRNGALLLGAVDRALGVTKCVATSIRETRQAGKIVHGLLDLVRQRVFGIACGYADCNDSARLRDD